MQGIFVKVVSDRISLDRALVPLRDDDEFYTWVFQLYGDCCERRRIRESVNENGANGAADAEISGMIKHLQGVN
jgi:hypothetical protein